MIRRDVLPGRDGAARQPTARPETTAPSDAHIELDPADHEEPTWEVRRAGDTRRRRLDGRTRTILAIAAAAALVVNAGAAWMYWRITGSETAVASGGDSVSMALRARNDLNIPLRPGATGNLKVTVTNDYDFPIRITSVTPGTGNVVADDVHREAGCKDNNVLITGSRFAVNWEVRRNTIGAFTVPGGLRMKPGADRACVGATFTVPVQAFGVRRELA